VRCVSGAASFSIPSARSGRRLSWSNSFHSAGTNSRPSSNRCWRKRGQRGQGRSCAVSRDITARRLEIDGPVDCSIRLDWFAKSKRGRLDRHEWASVFADHLSTNAGPTGIMLHHAVMDRDELDACEQVVQTLAAHPTVRVVPKDVVTS
jgi:hypothetical protein